MHEVDRRPQPVRRVKRKDRRGRVGQAERDDVSLAQRKRRGEVVRKGVDRVEHLLERIFFSVKHDRRLDGRIGDVQFCRPVHGTVFRQFPHGPGYLP